MHASITILITQLIFWNQISSSPTLNFSSRHLKFVFGLRNPLRYEHSYLLTLPSIHMHPNLQRFHCFQYFQVIYIFLPIKTKYTLYKTCKNVQEKLETLGQDVYIFSNNNYFKICLGSHRGNIVWVVRREDGISWVMVTWGLYRNIVTAITKKKFVW